MYRTSPEFILPLKLNFKQLFIYLRCYFNDVEGVLTLKGDLNVLKVTENFKTNSY